MTSQRPTTKAKGRISTLHPRGKHGVRIDRDRYDAMRSAILALVPRTARGISLSTLRTEVPRQLDRSRFPLTASTTWYLVAVKQDLEARGSIEIVPACKPQHLRRPRRSRR